jgi:hypothetical protein
LIEQISSGSPSSCGGYVADRLCHSHRPSTFSSLAIAIPSVIRSQCTSPELMRK